MAVSFSRPDPSSPDAVANATFPTSRRGFEQSEVRDLLRMVAAELARLQERERFLDRELRTSQRARPNAAIPLDEEVVTRMLGEEAARILSTAREAASQIKVRAEETAARLLRDTTDEAQRVREEAAVEAARRRQDAGADAESELQMAKQQGREMVNEARAYRERVLSELARRREMARQQIEQLVHGRDRLLQAFERARTAAVDVMAEMTPLGEPSEYVNLAPTTGPVPVMVPASRSAATTEPETSKPQLAAEIVEAARVVAAADDTALVEPAATDDVVVDEPTDDAADTTNVVSLFAGEIDVAAPGDDSTDDGAGDEGVDNDAVTPAETPVDAAAEEEVDETTVDAQAVEDLFARIRAARAESVAQRASLADDAVRLAPVDEAPDADATRTLPVFAATPPEPQMPVERDDSPFGRRDAALATVVSASARKLKRILADEQNEVLHTLRRNEPVRALDTMLPWESQHTQRYASAIDADLREAALAGAASVDDTADRAARTRDITRAHAVRPAIEALAASVVGPLRERLARAVTDAAGDNGELARLTRAIYREWKTQRINEHLDDVARIAFGRGALAGLKPGTPVTWTPDARVPLCADCNDNVLAGAVGAGKEFPTGHVCAPAHERCRCMLATTPR